MFIGVVKRLKEMDSTESAVFDLKKSWKQMTSDNVYIFVPNIIGKFIHQRGTDPII